MRPSSAGSVGLARAHLLTKTQPMKPSRQIRSSYGPPYLPVGALVFICAECGVLAAETKMAPAATSNRLHVSCKVLRLRCVLSYKGKIVTQSDQSTYFVGTSPPSNSYLLLVVYFLLQPGLHVALSYLGCQNDLILVVVVISKTY